MILLTIGFAMHLTLANTCPVDIPVQDWHSFSVRAVSSNVKITVRHTEHKGDSGFEEFISTNAELKIHLNKYQSLYIKSTSSNVDIHYDQRLKENIRVSAEASNILYHPF